MSKRERTVVEPGWILERMDELKEEAKSWPKWMRGGTDETRTKPAGRDRAEKVKERSRR